MLISELKDVYKFEDERHGETYFYTAEVTCLASLQKREVQIISRNRIRAIDELCKYLGNLFSVKDISDKEPIENKDIN